MSSETLASREYAALGTYKKHFPQCCKFNKKQVFVPLMMYCLKRSSTRQQSIDGMDSNSNNKESKRKSRNYSEKKRRDQFNLLLNELNSIVSTIGSRKMDKSAVLKAAISFLKAHNDLTVKSRACDFPEDWKPNFLTNEEFKHLILEAVDGFLIILSSVGNILYMSQNVTTLLGYIPQDILGMTVYDLVCPEEHDDMLSILTGPVTEEERPVSFSCHLLRTQQSIYEFVHFEGYFRPNSEADNSKRNGDIGNSRSIFIGTGRLQFPNLIDEMRLVDSDTKTEFTSQHSLEWKFLYLDHRAPPIIGYSPIELLGTSGYDYYHVDDLDRVVSCHDALMRNGEDTGCSFRFLTKGQQWIWLQTKFYITYNQWSAKPEFIVCAHRVVSYVDAIKNDGTTSLSKDASSSTNWYSCSTRNNENSQLSRTTLTSASNKINHRFCNISPNDNQPTSVVATHPQTTTSCAKTVISAPTYSMAVLPTSPIISQIPAITTDELSLTRIDLQKKHTELQAIIGQQQAELRRVSEQLSQLAQPQAITGNTLTGSYNTAGAVSNTTNVLYPLPVNGLMNL